MTKRTKRVLQKNITRKNIVKNAQILKCFGDFNKWYRYRFFYGGRGGGKSWAIARVLVFKSLTESMRILCAREFQKKIADSVKTVIEKQIDILGLHKEFTITKERIIAKRTGSEFFFMGIKTHPDSIRGIESVKICWVEEAANVSEESLIVLKPTVRIDGSEIWFSFNPYREDDAVYRMMKALNDDPNAFISKITWRNNPWFTKALELERQMDMKINPDLYNHIWEGETLKLTKALVFGDKVRIEDVSVPDNVRWFIGADWGFATDPCALVLCFMEGNILYIKSEMYATGIELEQLPDFFRAIPETNEWPIKADNSRPETISFMQRHGFNIEGAKKWQGSVKDGVAYLQKFEKIIIDKSCKNCIREFLGYSYKIDKMNGDVLPILEGKNDHTIDAVRYALDGYIKQDDQIEAYMNMANYNETGLHAFSLLGHSQW